ncbi:MAG: DUF1129 domain-containing protein [Lactobacillales bacterium]|nr:DUF1129 domain-containing protein [Lactobacillales bacterium]
MENEELRDLVEKNRELTEKLTKKNQQYMFDLNKQLENGNVSEETKVRKFAEMLPEIVEHQKSGQTARQLYGTVSERATEIIGKPEDKSIKKVTTKPALMWLDNFLLLLGLMGIMLGILGIVGRNKGTQFGIITLFAMAAVGGLMFYVMYKLVYQYEAPGADRSKRPGWFKTGLILVVGMFIWILSFTLTAFLPSVINPFLPSPVILVIGALAIGARMLLKKKYNIASSMQSQARR